MESVQEKYLLKWVWTLFSWHRWRQPPRPTNWANHPLCTSPVCLSKGHYCCSEFHRGLVKNGARCFSNDFLQITAAPGRLSSLHRFTLCALDVFFFFSHPSCHFPNLSFWFFSIPSFILLNTPCNISQGCCFSCSPQSSRRRARNYVQTWLLSASLLIHQIFFIISQV